MKVQPATLDETYLQMLAYFEIFADWHKAWLQGDKHEMAKRKSQMTVVYDYCTDTERYEILRATTKIFSQVEMWN